MNHPKKTVAAALPERGILAISIALSLAACSHFPDKKVDTVKKSKAPHELIKKQSKKGFDAYKNLQKTLLEKQSPSKETESPLLNSNQTASEPLSGDDGKSTAEILAQQSKSTFKESDSLKQALNQPAKKQVKVGLNVPSQYADKLVNLDFEQSSIRHVLKALAMDVGLNLAMPSFLPRSTEQVTLLFNRTPFAQVLKEVLKIADIHGKIEGNMLTISPLEQRFFHLDFMETVNQNSFSAGGDILGNAIGSSGNTGASTSSSSSSSNNISGEFRFDGTSMPQSNPYDALEAMLQSIIDQPEQTVVSTKNLAESGLVSTSEAEFTESNVYASNQTASYTLNRMTGTLYVQAKPSKMKVIADLIEKYSETLRKQVHIEAQILEVSLDDSHQWGIDWAYIGDQFAVGNSASGQQLGGISTQLPDGEMGFRALTIAAPVLAGLSGGSTLAASAVFQNFAATVNLLKEFGDVRVLSNPNIRTRHGQTGIITVGTSSSYVSQTATNNTTVAAGLAQTQNVTTSTVFDGLMLGVVPFIAENNSISLSVHPVQSRVNPASLALVNVGGDSVITLPEINIKTMMTQLKVNDGDIVIIGGLIDNTNAYRTNRIPLLSDIPFIGDILFSNNSEINTTKELVMVLKVNLI